MSRGKNQGAPASKLWDLFAADTLKKVIGITVLEGTREQIEDTFRKWLKGFVESLSAAGYKGDRLAVTVLKALKRVEKINVIGNGLGALVTGVVHALDDKVVDPRAKALLTGGGIATAAFFNSLDVLQDDQWDRYVERHASTFEAAPSAPTAPKPKALTFAFDRTDGCLHLLAHDANLDPAKDKDGKLVPACPAQQRFIKSDPKHADGLVPVSYEEGLRMRSAACPYCDGEAKRLHQASLESLAKAAAPAKAVEKNEEKQDWHEVIGDKGRALYFAFVKALSRMKGIEEKVATNFAKEVHNLPSALWIAKAEDLHPKIVAKTFGEEEAADILKMIEVSGRGSLEMSTQANRLLSLLKGLVQEVKPPAPPPASVDRSKEVLDALRQAKKESDPSKRVDLLLAAARAGRNR